MDGPLGLAFLLIENNCTVDFKFLLTSFIKDVYLNHTSIMHMNYNTARTTYLVKIISSTLREIDLILYSIEQTVKPPLCCLRRLYIHTTHTIQQTATYAYYHPKYSIIISCALVLLALYFYVLFSLSVFPCQSTIFFFVKQYCRFSLLQSSFCNMICLQ